MTKSTLIIVTDYGDQFAAAQVKAVALAEGFDGNWVENHSVTPFSVVEGAFQIKTISKYSPAGAVIVGVVDPGVGSSRKGLVIKTKREWLVGPDNGLLYQAARASGIEKAWEINERYFGKNVPKTFHGRDVFVKCEVLLTQGLRPDDIGCKQIRRIRRLEFKQGQVVHIDAFGNVKVHANKKPKNIASTFSDVAVGEPVVYWGSSDTLELAVNQGRGDDYFGVKLEEVIDI